MGMIPFYHPKPHPAAAYKDQPFPWAKSSPWSKLWLSFATPFFKIAHGRPLEEDGEPGLQPGCNN